jgi:hypothetical protein
MSSLLAAFIELLNNAFIRSFSLAMWVIARSVTAGQTAFLPLEQHSDNSLSRGESYSAQ